MTALHGIHHLALFTADMDETIRFWTNVLKAKLVRAAQDEGDPGTRHYYFDVGGSLVAFFHFPVQDRESLNFGWLHHLSLKVKSVEALKAWQNHIASFHVPVSDVKDRDFRKCIVLHDPNGILVELAVTTRKFTEKDLKLDPKPVLALKEILK